MKWLVTTDVTDARGCRQDNVRTYETDMHPAEVAKLKSGCFSTVVLFAMPIEEEQKFDVVIQHPGEFLKEELLEWSLEVFLHESDLPADMIGAIIHEHEPITPEAANAIAKFFDMSPDFWLNLQKSYELDLAKEMIRNDQNG